MTRRDGGGLRVHFAYNLLALDIPEVMLYRSCRCTSSFRCSFFSLLPPSVSPSSADRPKGSRARLLPPPPPSFLVSTSLFPPLRLFVLSDSHFLPFFIFIRILLFCFLCFLPSRTLFLGYSLQSPVRFIRPSSIRVYDSVLRLADWPP